MRRVDFDDEIKELDKIIKRVLDYKSILHPIADSNEKNRCDQLHVKLKDAKNLMIDMSAEL